MQNVISVKLPECVFFAISKIEMKRLVTVENCVVQNALAITVKVRILGECERKGIKERSGLRTIMLFILLRYLGPINAF